MKATLQKQSLTESIEAAEFASKTAEAESRDFLAWFLIKNGEKWCKGTDVRKPLIFGIRTTKGSKNNADHTVTQEMPAQWLAGHRGTKREWVWESKLRR